jgi:hypothetical protein
MVTFVLMMMVTAIVFKAIVPAGFMPESRSGLLEIVICSGIGEKTVFVPNSHEPSAEYPDDNHVKDICAYQVLASGKILLPLILTFLPISNVEQVLHAILADKNLFSGLQSSFEARGPPFV